MLMCLGFLFLKEKQVLLVVSLPATTKQSRSDNKRVFLLTLVHWALPSPSERGIVVDMLITEKVIEGMHHNEIPLQSCFHCANV